MTGAALKFMDGIALDLWRLNSRIIDSNRQTLTATKGEIMKLKLQACPAMAILAILLAAPATARADAVADWNAIAVQTISRRDPRSLRLPRGGCRKSSARYSRQPLPGADDDSGRDICAVPISPQPGAE